MKNKVELVELKSIKVKPNTYDRIGKEVSFYGETMEFHYY